MKCPLCLTTEMTLHNLEENLLSQHCPACGGHWINSFQYWKWFDQHGENLPEKPPEEGLELPVEESEKAKLCPECGHFLIRYKVGHELDFSLDRCGHCAGIWLDHNEWEILKSRHLHDDMNYIFSQPWQARVFREEHVATHEKTLLERFGEQDLEQIRNIKAWLDSHPRRPEIIAYLLQAARR